MRSQVFFSLARVVVAVIAPAALAACGAPASTESAASDTQRANAPVVLACADGDRDVQRRGTACLCCHSGEFFAAGSLDGAGRANGARDAAPIAHVEIIDALGRRVTVEPNALGNFFSHERLVAPLRASIIDANGRMSSMRADAPSGDCNACHVAGGAALPIGAARIAP